MYIVTELTDKSTNVRGVFTTRTKYDFAIDKILDQAELGSIISVSTGKLNGILSHTRCIENFAIEIVPEVRKAVRIS